jgi:hypothetical protein
VSSLFWQELMQDLPSDLGSSPSNCASIARDRPDPARVRDVATT